MKRRLFLRLEHWDGTEQHLIGRAAAICALVAVYSDRINGMNTGQLTLDWMGSALKPNIRENLPQLDTAASTT